MITDKMAQAIIDDIEKLKKSGELDDYLERSKPSVVDNKIREIFESVSFLEDYPIATGPPKSSDVIRYFESNPELIAVVETFNSNPPSSVTTRLSHARLHGGASQLEVAYVIAQLYKKAEYNAAVNGATQPDSIKSLCAEFPTVLSGGLAVLDGDIFVMPSCCTRFPESLMDWRLLLDGGDKPWLGHDPSPWVEIQGDNFLVWPNGGMGEEMDASLKPARFNRAQLKVALASVQQDIRDFLLPLRSWALHYCPADAESLVASFAKAFVDCAGD